MFLSKLVILAYFRYNSAKKKEKSLDKTPNISYYSLNLTTFELFKFRLIQEKTGFIVA